MGDSGFQTMAAQNPQLAPHAASPQPAWLWSADGSRILWCNDAGAVVFGVDDPHLLAKPRSPADPHGRQVAQLSRRLAPNSATRLERLRGFGARLGQLMTCACSRLQLRDGETGILVVAIELSIRVPPHAAPQAPAAAAQDASGANDALLGEPATDQELAEALVPDPRIEDAASPFSAAPPAEPFLREDEGREHPLSADDAASPIAGPEGGAPAITEPSTADSKPLRFVWQIDAAGRFSLTSDEFLRIAGERTVLVQGHAWTEAAQALDLDPHGRLAQAIAGHETFSGIVAKWPFEQGARGRVELSGMPVFDGARNFAGYRGFGICRSTASPSDDPGMPRAEGEPVEQPIQDLPDQPPPAEAPPAPDSFPQKEVDTVEPPQNVVPFPLANDTRMPSLSPGENHAFDEIARRLTQNFDDKPQEASPPAEPESPAGRDAPHEEELTIPGKPAQPAWLTAAAPPPRGNSATDRILLDLVPSGILIYRLDRLLYANRAFLARTGYDSVNALQDAGGLDALYVDPAPTSASSTSDEGMPLTIAPSAGDRSPSAARLFSILWDGEAAHALILQGAPAAFETPAAARSEPPPQAAATAPPTDTDNAFKDILETASDGIVLFDRSGAIVSANRSAEALFGVSAREFHALNFADLFAPESQGIVLDYFESLDAPIAATPIDHGREVLGRERAGGFIPLSMTMGRIGTIRERSDAALRTAMDGERFFAVFRDLSPLKKNESDLLNAQRKADRATAAKTDALASISHEIRGPLNTIIGFASIMIEERFGTLGNERYAEYLKDIRASGERAIAILDDIVNLSSIETGNLDLRPVSQNLNEMVEQCVGVLQPQANRERVIIRTSLAHALPLVMADTQALRQITMNIVTSSIRFSRAGGQVIVSTAPGENGGAILRVRDTGRGPSDAEVASAMSAHRASADRTAIDLSLARALAEANRAQFQIKTTESSGTLIEVSFANVRALAG